MTAPRHSVSIVLEWETVLAAGRARAVRCLASLHRQIARFVARGGACELIVSFDAAQASRDEVTTAIAEAAAGERWASEPLVTSPPERLDYYSKKNHGFGLTKHELVAFLDSDLIPEDDWLENLVAAFDDYRRSVVVGRTHFDTATLYERAVALFWIFDTRDASHDVRATQRLVSNNIAFRRAVFAHFPFPTRPTFRGQCAELGRILAAHRIPLFEQPAARASHPPPQGVAQFFDRALHAGRDQAFYDELDGVSNRTQPWRQWRVDLGHVRDRIAARRRNVGAGAASIAAGFALGFVYYSIKLGGYLTA